MKPESTFRLAQALAIITVEIEEDEQMEPEESNLILIENYEPPDYNNPDEEGENDS